jgi:Rrf2 family transcriptional regulator, repressor of oqxAB
MSYSTAFSQAIVTSVFVGDKIRQGAFEFVPTSAICKSLNLKAPTLAKILNNLARVGIIETKEGKAGGVRLKLAPDKLTLLMIFEAIEADRPLFQTHLNLSATGPKPDKAKKVLLRVLRSAEAAMKDSLAKVTIANYLDDIA